MVFKWAWLLYVFSGDFSFIKYWSGEEDVYNAKLLKCFIFPSMQSRTQKRRESFSLSSRKIRIRYQKRHSTKRANRVAIFYELQKIRSLSRFSLEQITVRKPWAPDAENDADSKWLGSGNRRPSCLQTYLWTIRQKLVCRATKHP